VDKTPEERTAFCQAKAQAAIEEARQRIEERKSGQGGK
jgi:hypothetical protein